MFARRFCCLVLVVAIGVAWPAWGKGDDNAPDFNLRDGDRVVLLGGTLIEREQQFGYWETLLTVAREDRNVTFRNLGWSGDTVWGESRGMFEPHLGYERLLEQVQAANPTVVLVAYGTNEAFAGEAGLEPFVAQYAKLLDDLASTGRRFVLVDPLEMEAESPPGTPESPADRATAYNRHVDLYAAAIRTLGKERGHGFIDLRSHQRKSRTVEGPLTLNGLHLTDVGYRRTARWLVGSLSPSAGLDDFEFDAPAARDLRAAIIAKNQLFFHRWRPQNFTYLFGFRKYEQGQNAVEVPQFDPLIEAAEQRITDLARAALPSPQTPMHRDDGR